MTQALILAAGNGSRLGSAANGLPKCMIRVGPDSLIGHQTRALRAAGVSRIAAVVGYGAERVQEHCGDGLSYVHNERFKETNSLYSLWLARHWIDGPFYLLNCDVLFCDQVLGRLAAIPGSALAFDALSGHDPEHMKVCIRDQLVCGLGKSMPRSLTRGENIGVLRFDACSAESLFRAAGQLIADGQLTAWAPAAVERMTVECDVRAVDVSDLPWCEIDFPGDLDEARNRVWPLIAAGRETNPRVAECDSVRAGAAPRPVQFRLRLVFGPLACCRVPRPRRTL